MIAAMCTQAYREALTRNLSSTNPPQDDLESRGVAAAGAVAESVLAMAFAQDAMVVNGEAIDQR